MEENKVVIIGDTHFGIRRFSIDFLENQLRFFNEELFPFMIENKINKIYQLGDLFDNRTTCDIMFLETIKEKFFDVLLSHNFELYTLLGNHDLVLRESRELSLVNTIERIYPNIFVYKNRQTINLCNRQTYIVPWITKNETLTAQELKDKEIVLGHFEIRNFSMVKGHIDTSSELTEKFFKENKVDMVFSGHYHIKNTYGDIKYLGTPFQLNWNDFDSENGFYSWDGFILDFFDNTVSKKHVKVKYNDEDSEEGRFIEVTGLFKTKKFYNSEEFKSIMPLLKNHEVKFIINKAKTTEYDEILYSMKENKVQPKTIVDNQEIRKLTDINMDIDVDSVNIDNTRELILKTIEKENKDLTPLILDILSEVESNKGNKN